jgi:hypothetical protein
MAQRAWSFRALSAHGSTGRAASKSSKPRGKPRRHPRSRRLLFEALDPRAMLAGDFASLALNGSSQILETNNAAVGQDLSLSLEFSTTDTTTPEQIKNVPVEIATSTGWSQIYRDYGLQQVTVPYTQTGETVSAWIAGYDGQESATLSTGDNVITVDQSLSSSFASMQTLASELAAANTSLENLISLSAPNWEVLNTSDVNVNPNAQITGQIAVEPDGQIDSGQISFEGSIQLSDASQLYWGLPSHVAGVNVDLGITMQLTVDVTADWNAENGWEFTGSITPQIETNLSGSLSSGAYQGFVAGSASISLPLTLYSSGEAESPMGLVASGNVNGAIQWLPSGTTQYDNLANIAYGFGPQSLESSPWTWDLASVVSQAIRGQEQGNGFIPDVVVANGAYGPNGPGVVPLGESPPAASQVVVSQIGFMPAAWTAGDPYVAPGDAFTISASVEDQYGNLYTAFNGPVTIALDNDPYGGTLDGTLTVSAVNGIATFSGLTLDATGTGYTAVESASGLTSVESSPFDVADPLAIVTAAPGSVATGAPFGVTVEAQNSSGGVDTSFSGNVTVSLSSMDGAPITDVLQGTQTVPLVNGVGTFTGLSVNVADPYDDLVFSGDGLVFTSQLLNVEPAGAAELELAASPPDITANSSFSVEIDATDSNGNIVPGFTGNVTLSLASNPGGATLGGTLTVAAVNGVASFSGLTLNAPGTGYTLEATASGLTSVATPAFDATAAAVASQLVVTGEPPSALAAGSTFGLVVKAEDSAGNVDTTFNGVVTIALDANPVNGTLNGTLTATATNGVATFTGLSLDTAGSGYTIAATAESLNATETGDVTVHAAAATTLVVSGAGGNILTGGEFRAIVDAEDIYGNIVPSFNGTVTMSLTSDSGALGGTLTASASGGAASFSNLAISTAGSYTLQATSSGMVAGTLPLSVTNDQLVVTTDVPSSVAAGSSFSLVVKAENDLGNADTSFNGAVKVALISFNGGSTTLGGAKTVTAVNGVATFSGLTIYQDGQYSLAITATNVGSTSVDAFSVTASELDVDLQPPAIVTAGGPFSLTVSAGDAGGDVDPTYAGLVTLSMGYNPSGASLGGTLTAVAVNGVATFNDVTLSQADADCTLQASADGLSSTETNPFTVDALGTATQLVVVTPPPTSVAAGSAFGLVVKAEDFQGNVDTTFNGAVTLSDSIGALRGTLVATAVNGVITFSGLTIDLATKGDVLTVTTAGQIQPATSSITITPAAASQLLILPRSSDILTGASFAVNTLVEDAYGNPVPNYSGSETISLESGPAGATLGGTLTMNAANGEASFTGLSINESGVGYAFHVAGAGGLSVTGPSFSVFNDMLVFTTQPAANISAGGGFGLVVKAENGAGAVDTSFSGCITISDPSFVQTLSGTTTVTAVNGVATFTGLSLSAADSGETFVATSGNLPAAVSSSFNVVPAAASRLAVAVQPPTYVTVGSDFEAIFDVDDSFGNLQTSFSGNVTIAMAPGSANGGLGGTLTVAAVNGVASFSWLLLNNAGSGYTLQAASSGLTSTTTSGVNVRSTGAATQLVVSTDPPSGLAAGGSFGLVVAVEDSFGNLASGFNGSVTIANSNGAALGGTLTVTAVNGVATFSGLSEDQAATGATLIVTSSGLDSATTTPFTVSPLAATQFVVLTPLADALASSSFSVFVLAEDQFGNIDPTYSGSVTISLANSPGGAILSGTLTVNAVDGVAYFSGLSISQTGAGYTIQASGNLASGNSTPFNLTTDDFVVATQPPSGLLTGNTFGFVVEAENAAGAVDTSFTGSVTVALVDLVDNSPTLSGTLTVTAVDGVATFSGLSLNEAGEYMLAVTDSGVGQGFTSPFAIASPPVATVSSVSPGSGPTSGDTTVIITGTNFGGATAVDFGGMPAISFVINSATQITAVSPAGAAGSANVTVVTPGGTSATSSADTFVYVVTTGDEIMDNSQPGFWSSSYTTWSTISSGIGGTSLVSSTPNGSDESQAAWWFSMPAGLYELSITYTAAATLTQDMGLDLYDGVGNWIGQIPVNERVAPNSFTEDGVAWENLGAFEITSNLFHISTWNSQSDGAICVNGLQLQAAPVIDSANAPNSYKYYPTGYVGYFTTSGSWTTSSQGAFGGSDVSNSAAGSGSSVATWTMPVTPGSYEVDVTWPASGSLSGSATYDVYNGGTLLGSATVDQQSSPSGVSYDGLTFQTLGTFTVTGTQLSVTLANTNGQVDANAIRILPSYQPSQIVDEGLPGFWSNADWTTQGTGLYGASLVSSSANGSEQSQAAWWFPVQPGQYDVQISWVPGGNLSSSTPFDIYNASAYVCEPTVNEQNAPVGVTDQGVVWQSLGVFTMTSDVLHISTWNSQTNGAMNIDGIRIVPV